MGQLVEGIWKNVWYDTKSTGGRFKRTVTSFRNRIGTEQFPAQANRYHLYVSLACPWAHRTLIFRELKGLQKVIGVSVVHPVMLEHGWTFGTDFPAATGDPVNNKKYLYEIYTAAQPDYTGRVTVPVLWDTVTKTIVNNESSEIIEIFNDAFNGLEGVNANVNLFPKDKLSAMTELDSWIYDTVNNGVYKSGFATSQEAYDENIGPLFKSLDRLEEILSKKRYLTGDKLTASDIRLFTTLVRFDHVYVTHFKCDKKRIVDYPNLFGYLCDIYQLDTIASTVNLDHIRTHYFRSHPTINPYGIVSVGPTIDWTRPHGRESLSS